MIPMPSTPPRKLTYTDEVKLATDAIYAKLSDQYQEKYWQGLAPYICEINRLKKEKNAVILAHNYQTPDIFHGIADIVGDSLQLAREAAKTDADIIIQCGVYFMAETSKILCPDKTVLIPDAKAGCSLADSITAADVRLLREKYPNVPIVTYVNSSAEVKAESDICCTSGNAVKIVNALESDTVLMIPDEYLAQYVQTQTTKKILTWKGHCEVHERFTVKHIEDFRAKYPDITVLAHPECPPDVIAASDYAGSTAQMIDFVESKRPARVVLITECSMSDNIAAAHPDIQLIRPCQMCPHMKRISLPKILTCLETLSPAVEVDAIVAAKAKQAVDRMLALS
jgi:quinolinate synthase